MFKSQLTYSLKWVLFIFSFYLPSYLEALQGSGGLSFQKAKPILIKRQDITLNPEKVSTSYVFWNSSSLDKIETMVFTLPTADPTIPSSCERNIQSFHVTVNGREIDYQIEKRAMNGFGIDVTTLLLEHHLPLDPKAAQLILENSQSNKKLIKALEFHDLYDPKQAKPRWTAQTYYYWQQLFEAGKETHIQQTYKPMLQMSEGKISVTKEPQTIYHTFIEKIRKKNPDERISLRQNINFHLDAEKYGEHLKQFCPNQQDYKALLSAYNPASGTLDNVITKELFYTLKDESLWSGPREHFTLKINTNQHTHPLLCWNLPLQKRSESSWISEALNFIPIQDIQILFIEKVKS